MIIEENECGKTRKQNIIQFFYEKLFLQLQRIDELSAW